MNNETQPVRIPTQPCPIQHQETQTMINPYVRYMDNAENELQKQPAKHDALAVLCLVFAFLFWPLSIFLGHRANREARQAFRQRSVLTTIGLVISYAGMAGIVLLIVAGIAGSHS
jgi:hypothetical protein